MCAVLWPSKWPVFCDAISRRELRERSSELRLRALRSLQFVTVRDNTLFGRRPGHHEPAVRIVLFPSIERMPCLTVSDGELRERDRELPVPIVHFAVFGKLEHWERRSVRDFAVSRRWRVQRPPV